MKIILFKFEKEIIHTVACDIKNKTIQLTDKKKVSLTSATSKGQKYALILQELSLLKKHHHFDSFAYQAAQKYRGSIKDEESFAHAAMLHLFCEQENIDLIELTAPRVREALNLPSKDFKLRVENEKSRIIDLLPITKSDKLLDGLVLLRLLKLD